LDVYEHTNLIYRSCVRRNSSL